MALNRSLPSSLIALAAAASVLGCSSSDDQLEPSSRTPVEIVSFTADPSALDFGGTAVLSWKTKGAARVVVSEGGEALLDSTSEPSGLLEVTPLRTTTYSLSAIGPRAERSAMVRIEVRPAILELSTDASGEVAVGNQVRVSWRTGGADELVLSTTDGFSADVSAEAMVAGSMQAPVPADGIFTLTARSGELEARREVNVLAVAVDAPVIDSFTSSLDRITIGQPETAELAWSVTGATSLTLKVNSADPVDLGAGALSAGSREITVDEATVLVLEAGNLKGTVTSTLVIAGSLPPRISTFLALPSRVAVGEAFTLSWATADAATIELEREGEPLDAEALAPSDSLEQTIAADTTYLLRARNDAGFAVESSLTVTVGAPLILSFGPDRANVAPDSPVSLEWAVDGGTSMRIRGPDGAELGACASSDLATVHGGSCPIVAPSEFGAYVYELLVRNGPGEEVRATAVVQVVNGPTIDEFRASASSIDAGGTVILSWKTGTNAEGVSPSLTLTDDQGSTPYSLEGKSVASDSIELTLASPGIYKFTLLATTPGTSSAEATLTVTVQPIPTVSLSASPNPYDPGAADHLVLSWTTTDAVSLTIWELDAEGTPLEPALHTTADEADLAAGSLDLDPDHTTQLLAQVENLNGTTREASYEIVVLLPAITRFDASPQELIQGETSLLSWTTERTERVSLDFDPGLTSVIGTAPFLDLSDAAAHPGAASLPWQDDSCGSGGIFFGGDPSDVACPVLSFPRGFTFRYDGELYDRAKVFADGVLSFDLAKDYGGFGGGGSNLEIPVTNPGDSNHTGWTEILAPLWQDMSFRTDFAPDAGFFYDLKTDPSRGDYLVILWKGLGDKSFVRGSCAVAINFEVLLWADGGFEYRYQIADTTTANCNGAIATIGFQNQGGAGGTQLSFKTAVSGGLNGKSYSFEPATLLTDGSLEVAVPETRTFTLTAYGARGYSSSREVTVRAHRPSKVLSSRVEPAQPTIGELATLSWNTLDATAVILRGPDGEIVCAAQDNTIPAGGCSFTRPAPGTFSYTLAVVNTLGTETTQVIPVQFWDRLEITSLTASPAELRADSLVPVALSWKAQGATSARILADGVDLSGSVGAIDPNDQSLTFTPNRSTTYQVEITGADGRKRSRDVQVPVRTFETGTIGADILVSDGTQPVTISWDSTTLVGGKPTVTMEPESFPMVEVLDAPFIDLVTNGGIELPGSKTPDGEANAPTAETLITFPDGFSFPFFGTELSGIYPATSGYISLMSSGNFNESAPLLEYSGGSEWVHIAPFWDFLRSYGKGRILTKFVPHATDPEKDQFVVQWNEMQFYQSPPPPVAAAATDDLTFQAGLFRDGSIEFRYKTMSSPTFPQRPGATNAAIGYHELIRQADLSDSYYRGFELFYRVTNPVNLNGRSYRYRARKAQDSLEVNPEKTTEYKICIELDGFKECKTAVVVVPDAGDLLITELALDPAGGAAGQWFEVRNTTPHPFDLRGMSIVTNAGEHLIEASAPVIATPGEFLILAASASPILAPDYVYGTGLPLGKAVDSLTLRYKGRDVARASWDAGWNLPAGKTLALDAVRQRAGVLINDDPSAWCEGTAEGSVRSAWSCSSRHYDYDPFSTMPFIDISQTGTAIASLSGLNTTSILPGGLGFTIPYFGVNVSSLWISSNGFAGCTGSPDAMAINEVIPNPESSGPGIIAPLWDAFSDGSGTFYFQRLSIDGQQVVVLQWNKKVRFNGSGLASYPGSTTFQTQIWSNGDIVHAYGYMSAIKHSTPADLNPKQEHFGGDGTVGIEAIGSEDGIQYLYKQPILYEGLSIHFIRK